MTTALSPAIAQAADTGAADHPGGALPHLAQAPAGIDDAPAWLAAAMPRLEPDLLRAGAVLFRGLPLREAEHFRAAVAALAPSLRDYAGGTSPRSQVADGVYTSTEYPKHLEIPLHNEMSYASRWPGRLYFFCAQEPQAGGETPLADSRRILQALPPDLVEQFERRQLLYVRNLAPAASPHNAWSKAFETADRDEVQTRCRELDIQWQWQPGGGLRIQERRSATCLHPHSGERVWFNQAHLFHASNTLGERAISPSLEDGLPMAVYFGDGERIPAATLARVRQTLRAQRRCFRWRQGDLLVVDNLLAAHGRLPFDGPRRILVAMS